MAAAPSVLAALARYVSAVACTIVTSTRTSGIAGVPVTQRSSTAVRLPSPGLGGAVSLSSGTMTSLRPMAPQSRAWSHNKSLRELCVATLQGPHGQLSACQAQASMVTPQGLAAVLGAILRPFLGDTPLIF